MPGVFCHFINNGIAVLSMILYPDETTTEMLEDTMSLVMILAISLVVFAVSFFYAKKQLPKPL